MFRLESAAGVNFSLKKGFHFELGSSSYQNFEDVADVRAAVLAGSRVDFEAQMWSVDPASIAFNGND